MTRPLRLEFAGALYHVTARGDHREAIYKDDAIRRDFLQARTGIRVHFRWLSRTHANELSALFRAHL